MGSVTSQQIGTNFGSLSGPLPYRCSASDGQLVCFGLNRDGQCDVPADLGPILAVSAGRYHTCAMRPDGQLVCFGYSRDGQCDVPADLGPVLAVSTADSIRVQCGQMVSSSALDAMVMDSETCQHIWHQFNEV